MHATRRLLFAALLCGIPAATTSAIADAPESNPKIVTPPVTTPISSDQWTFRIEPYGWVPGLDGTIGAGGLTTKADVGVNKVLKHLDFAAAIQLEARKGKWGILADGFYAKLGDVGDSPGPLYANVSGDLEQVILQLAIAYRVVENPRGFVDVYVGARYNSLTLNLSATVDQAGVQRVSDEASARIVNAISARVRGIEQQKIAEFIASLPADKAKIEQSVRNAVRSKVDGTLAKDITKELLGTHGLAPESVPRAEADRITGAVAKQSVVLREALVEQSAATLKAALKQGKSNALGRAQARVAQAEKNLAKAINRQIVDRLPTDISAQQQWADPLIGLRGQINLSERFFLALSADIGGFGVSSRLTSQLQATAGYNFNKNIYAELGYRYLYTDYSDGGFLYDISEAGVFIGFGFKF